MQIGTDLTARQTTRVIEQALRTKAEVEIEPRNLPDGSILKATFAGRESELLVIELCDDAPPAPTSLLIGAFCEVRLVLSEEMHTFSTFVLDAPEGAGKPRILMAAPEVIQVANRRRFERTNVTIASQVRFWIKSDQPTTIGLLANVCAEGLACNLPGLAMDEPLSLGDEARVAFELAGFDDLYELPVTICNKSIDRERGQLCLGLQFVLADGDTAARDSHRRLQAALYELTANLSDMDGEI